MCSPVVEGSVQSMASHRIKLLITLVLFMVAVAAIWTPTQSEARSLSSPTVLSAVIPDATPAAGDPDIGQGAAPPPAPTLKRANQSVGDGNGKYRALSEWVLWAGRIWATLYLRVFG